MVNYLCEEKPSCTNFQSAICLHCNQRLCLTHITEHNKIVFRDVENLSTELDATSRHIQELSEKNKLTFTNVVTSLDAWRAEQIEQIHQIHQNQLQLITGEQETVQQFGEQLLQKLDLNVRQQLDLIKAQQNVSMAVLNCIQQTIRDVRKESENFTGVFLTLPTVRIQEQQSNSSNQKLVAKEKKISPNNRSATNEQNAAPVDIPSLRTCRPTRRYVQMFSNLSAVPAVREQIHAFIRKQGASFRFDVLVCSYLLAWYEKPRLNAKVFLLNEHILTIQQYFDSRITDYDILFGIQGFLHAVKVKQPKASVSKARGRRKPPSRQMMDFLLDFFCNAECLTENLILSWYHSKNLTAYKGFSEAKQLANSFVKSITMQRPVSDPSPVDAAPVNMEQSGGAEIKGEPMSFE